MSQTVWQGLLILISPNALRFYTVINTLTDGRRPFICSSYHDSNRSRGSSNLHWWQLLHPRLITRRRSSTTIPWISSAQNCLSIFCLSLLYGHKKKISFAKRVSLQSSRVTDPLCNDCIVLQIALRIVSTLFVI
jgi:hypothetical protein